MINFPEISMWGMFPWGGFGATPLLGRFRDLWAPVRDRLAGGFPYSEGIYEDINKVACAGFYWSGGAEIEETIDAYAHYELGNEDVETVRALFAILEANHGACWYINDAPPAEDTRPSAPIAGYPGARRILWEGGDAARAARAWADVRALDAGLPAWARAGWRWRLLYLRAFIDSEILHNGGDPTPACRDAFAELARLYCADDAATLGVVNH